MKKKYLLGTLGAGLMLTTATAASAAGGAIYDAIPDPLPATLPSLGGEAYAFSQLGDRVQMAEADRELDSVELTMVSWACEEGTWGWDGQACATTPGATFDHELTLSLYQVEADGAVGAEIASVEQTFAMPYRPSTSEKCFSDDGNNTNDGRWWSEAAQACQNGFAFNVKFDLLDAGVTLPDEFLYGISYNTRTSGAEPIGQPGPYDSLNIGLNTTAPSVGMDLDRAVLYKMPRGAGQVLSPWQHGWGDYSIAIRFNTMPSGPTTADDCKGGGFEKFGFANQGQCVASVNANERAGK